MKTLLAVIGGLWIVGRISRRSRNHPVHVIPELLGTDTATDATLPEENGLFIETAQFQSATGMVAGEGGGE